MFRVTSSNSCDAICANASPELGCFRKLPSMIGPRAVRKCACWPSGRASWNCFCWNRSSQATCSGLCRTARATRLEAGGREELDHLREADGGCRGVEGIEDAERVDAVRMLDREVDRRGAGSVVSDRDDPVEAQCIDDRSEIPELLLEAVAGAGGPVGRAESQEVECDDPTTPGDQVGDQVVEDVQVVGEAVHEHEGGAGALVDARIDLPPRAEHDARRRTLCRSFGPSSRIGAMTRLTGRVQSTRRSRTLLSLRNIGPLAASRAIDCRIETTWR